MSNDNRLREGYLDCNGLSMEQLESFGNELAFWAKWVNFFVGDVARAAAKKSPENWSQAFPVGMSPGYVARCKAVAEAYPTEESRNLLASWSIHKNLANDPDRVAKVQSHVDEGRTSDEAKEADKVARSESNGKPRWLLAIDVGYYVHRQFYSGAGVETAQGVASWIERTVERLKAKGLTDVACCFDGPNNHRRELTSDWEDGYKAKRSEKEPELIGQLHLVRNLLEAKNFACVSVDRMEADDCLHSYAVQFDGKVTIMSTDKDARQSLSSKCNILADVEWEEDETSGQSMPKYKWITAKSHTEEGCTYNGVKVTGISPEQFPGFQTLAGDSADGVTGAKGIGAKFAMDLIKEFGSPEAAIEAAKAGDERIKPAKRQALIDLEPRLEITKKLVTMRSDLELSAATRV